MAANSNPTSTGLTAVRVLINLIYILGAIVGLLAGCYGIFIFIVAVIVYPSFYLLGLMYGLPLILISTIYLTFLGSLLFMRKFRSARYRMVSWILALLGVAAICLLVYYIFVSLLGF